MSPELLRDLALSAAVAIPVAIAVVVALRA